MRAKFIIDNVQSSVDQVETLYARPVTDGSDENKSFSRWTPGGHLELQISNPDLLGYWKTGDQFYLDFHKIEPEAVQPTAEPQ